MWVQSKHGANHLLHLQQLQINGCTTKGFNIVIGGDVPLGAGLSSSAALECASLFAFSKIFSLDVPLIDIVKMAQRAENDFVGVQCGICESGEQRICAPAGTGSFTRSRE